LVTSPVGDKTVCTTAPAFLQVENLQNLEQLFKFPVAERAIGIIGYIFFHVYKLPCQFLTGFLVPSILHISSHRLEDTKFCVLHSAKHWLLI
jgi:hypothetical protein